MTRIQKAIIGLLAVFACSGWLAFLVITSPAYQSWSQRPLGPILAYPTEWQLPATWTASPPVHSPDTVFPTDTLIPTLEIATETSLAASLDCRTDLPGMTVLAIGTDVRPGERRYGLADVMRAVRVDFQGQRVSMLEFPRDLWVRIPGLRYSQKLNTAYSYGSPDHGPSLLARTLDENFGLTVDHYVLANMNVFAEVVDALGGFDIMIPAGGIDGRTSIDRSERLIFQEGLQHLNGEQALTLVRLRNKSVFARAENQNLVMCALRKKLESPEVILRVPAIINAFLENIQTDLTPEQIGQLACLGTQMPRSNIFFAAFPRELFRSAEVHDPVLDLNVSIWEADFNRLRRYVSDFASGSWPSTISDGASEPAASTCE